MKFHVKALAMVLATAAFSTAQAQDASVGSKFFFQAPAGTSQLTGHVGYRNWNLRSEGETTDSTVAGLSRLGAAFEFGLNEMFSLGADVSYTSLQNDADQGNDFEGLEDPAIFLKGTMPMEMARLRFGATLGLGFPTPKVETGSFPVGTGQFSLAPYIGLDADVGPGILGARLAYSFRFAGTVDAAGTDRELTGGNALSASGFYEYILSDMLLGAAVNFRNIEKSEVEQAGGTKTEYFPKTTPIGLSAYIRIPMTEASVIVPRLDYDFSGGDEFDKYSDMTLSVAARFAF